LKHSGAFACIFDRHANKFSTDPRRYVGWGARFSKVPAHYPDPRNPGHYTSVFKIPTTLNDGQQQPVDNFAPRANLKWFFEDCAISSGDSEVKLRSNKSVFLLSRSTCLSISDILRNYKLYL
jgi:hypothetical protein